MDKENKYKITDNPQLFIKTVSVFASVIMVIFEIIICASFMLGGGQPAWMIAMLIVCSVALDVLFIVEIYCVKTIKARIIMYAFDVVLLLSICAITGSVYLCALFCVILTQFYINVDDIKPKIIVVIASCVVFVVTCIVGWLIRELPEQNRLYGLLDIISGNVIGLLALVVHFLVTNFLISFYRTNVKLTQALKAESDSKTQLKEAYDKLSETTLLEERNRIARDIHDNAGHSMTAVIMQTEAAKLLIDTNPEEAKAKMISANIQAKNALEQMRESVHLLAGREQQFSFKEELEAVIAQTMDGTDIVVRYNIDDAEVDGDRRRFLVSSLKECFSNGIRHGGASAFYVEFSVEEGMASLMVSDNGCGLKEDFKEGFGLKGIRERATAFGGSIVIASEEDDGCEIKIIIKAAEEESDD